ncbi:capsule assembly Wzi family protein [Algoriphagus yeomjeoni]|uniref:Capsule assembly protein Wzi n=1 Tax=Algoriphagus yeomjeoni TaxID=291403 RepID=A0A327PK83_9BACT|nr:capsule assembly Wzi family protein [Algoriphagus yeomjeoni]RAI91654.1 capsule assembly protein Wzi [Algoriphagus yeomjeoni]
MRSLFVILFLFLVHLLPAQVIPAGLPVLEERARINQLMSDSCTVSFNLRPIQNSGLFQDYGHQEVYKILNQEISYSLIPLISTVRFNTARPYGGGGYGMIPNVGVQQYVSTGFNLKYKFISIQFQPELLWASNNAFQGFGVNLPDKAIFDRFHTLNVGDHPERFGTKTFGKAWLGQSKITFQFGAFEIGGATQNIWWGPGQFNSLTFSNNARGFPHLTFNTTKPAKTFMGSFEGQIIVGKLVNSGIAPLQNQTLNDRFFKPLKDDWRYLNAMTISYSPKWLSGISVGLSRTFQQYSTMMQNDFGSYFPIFDPFQKESLFDENGTSVEFDALGRDQSATVFFRIVSKKYKGELYGEYGRRDHAFNWRDFIISPEHARAFLLGFIKIVPLSSENRFLQVRGEITHQQESVNRYLRYAGLGGEYSWHTHGVARGFVNDGIPLGVGIGMGSNVQTLEFSIVEKMDKMGILVERLANQQDFYYRAFGQQSDRKPWIDLSIGFLFDKKWGNLLLSSKLQIIHARNYQWQLDPASTPDFPVGENMTSFLAQTSLIYFWNKGKD